MAQLLAPASVPTAPVRAPARPVASRAYAGARAGRLTSGFGASSASANGELELGLPQLRNRSRELIRDSAYAKRAKTVVVNNVIGTGIGLQAEVRGTRDELRESVNTGIERAWDEWCAAPSCHTGGVLHFCDLERHAMGQVFETGEVLIRLHPVALGDSRVPLALELIEPERLADNLMLPGPDAPGNKVVMGVEVNAFHRPQAYWLRRIHPGEIRYAPGEVDRLERVGADWIFHLYLCARWPQNRGEPWMHATLRKLADIDAYSEAEIVAARAAAMYVGAIESPEGADSFGEEQEDGSYQMPTEPGTWEKLAPGEKLNMFNPQRPNSALDPFLRYMLREMAAGVGVSYESLSRDYSQSNYSSSRLALIEDRDNWRALQQWFIRSFRCRLHRLWLRQATLAGAIPGLRLEEYAADPEKFSAASFKPRGWSWIDPTSEVGAYKDAIKSGLTTVAQVIAETGGGRDLEQVLKERRRELDDMAALGLVFETSPDLYTADAKKAEADAEKAEADAEAALRPPPEPAAPAMPAEPMEPGEMAADRMLGLVQRMIEVQASTAAQFADALGKFRHNTLVTVPERSVTLAPTIHVEPPDVVVHNAVAPPTIHVEPAPVTVGEVRVEVAAPEVQVAAPTVTVEAPQVTVQPPAVQVAAPTVNVAAPAVTVRAEPAEYEVIENAAVRDAKGRISKVVVTKQRTNRKEVKR